MFVRFIGTVVLLLGAMISAAQQFSIIIKDSKTSEPVAFAHVCIESLKNGLQKHYVSDINGKVPNETKEPAQIAISYVGYETLRDTIYPAGNVTLLLKPAVFNISEVVVTAQFAPERADKSIYKVNVINSRQIEQKAATNLSDLLSSESNIHISQDGVLGTSMKIQGLSGENVKFLIDGVPVIGRMNGNIDLNQLNLYNVDHIELIEGPMSVVYGSNAIAGVVNIITRENKYGAFSSFGNAYYESAGVYNFDAGASYRIKRHLLSADGARNFFDGFPNSDESRNVSWKPKRQYNGSLSYLLSGAKYRFKISGQIFDELLLDKGPLLAPYYEHAFDSYFNTTRYTLKTEGSAQTGSASQISYLAAFNKYSRIKKMYYKDLTTLEQVLTVNPEDHDTSVFDNYMIRAWFSNNHPEKQINYQAGLDISTETGEGKRILNRTQFMGDYAAFITARYDALKTLTFQPGLRLIYNTKFDAPVIYSLNIKWDAYKNWTLRTSYARGYRAPSLKEQYLYFVDINHNVQGNPELKAEYSHNANLSLTYKNERSKTFISSEALLFYNNVRNNITLAHQSGSLYTYINVGRYIAGGWQVSTNYSFYPGLSTRIGIVQTARKYAFTDEQRQSETYSWSTDLNWNLSYKFIKPAINATIYYKYTGKYPEIIPLEDGTLARQLINGYHVMDITLLRSFIKERITVSAGVKNLFDNKRLSVSGDSGGGHGSGGDGGVNIAWGRTFFLKLSYNFNHVSK